MARPLLAIWQSRQFLNRYSTGAEDRVLVVGSDASQAKAVVESRLAIEVEDFELDGAERPGGVVQYQYVGPSERDEAGASTASPLGPAIARTIVSTLAM